MKYHYKYFLHHGNHTGNHGNTMVTTLGNHGNNDYQKLSNTWALQEKYHSSNGSTHTGDNLSLLVVIATLHTLRPMFLGCVFGVLGVGNLEPLAAGPGLGSLLLAASISLWLGTGELDRDPPLERLHPEADL